MRQLRTGFLLVALISAIAVSAQQVASGGSSPADILYSQPGTLVSVNGFRLNLYCMGSGSPTVIFDSGWGDWAPAWSKHHAGIGGPYILVGAAFGGDNVRTFADLYMGEVAGLVLIDADSTDVEPKSSSGISADPFHRGE